jgi:hypothetical protein
MLLVALHVTQALYQPLSVKVNAFMCLTSHYHPALQLWISTSLLMLLIFLEAGHNLSPLL